MVKYRKIPPAAATNQIAGNARIPPAPDLQKNNEIKLFIHFAGPPAVDATNKTDSADLYR